MTEEFLSSCMFHVVCELKEVKHYLKSWNSKFYGKFYDIVDENASQINKVQEKFISDPLNLWLINWHARLVKQCEH